MVAMDTKVSMKKMLSASDDPGTVVARGAVMWLAHEASHEVAAIAEAFGRDPSEVESTLSAVEHWIEVDPDFVAFLLSYQLVMTVPVGGDKSSPREGERESFRTYGPWERTADQLCDDGMMPRPDVSGLLFDLRTLPGKYDAACDDDYRPLLTSWLTEVWELAGTRIKGEPRAPVIMCFAEVIHAACVAGNGSACVTFAALSRESYGVPETAQRVVRFLHRRGMIAIRKGKTAARKSGNVYRLRGTGI